jgi:leucyl-tRNA synthetase
MAEADEALRIARSQAVKRVDEDMGRYKPNTAIAAMMELVNTLGEHQSQASGPVLREVYETLLQLLHPTAPHITEELWRLLGHDRSVLRCGWPSFDAGLLARQQVTIAVQINGKLRTTFQADPGLDAAAVESRARELAARWLDDKQVVKVIHVPDRLLSFVVKG